MTKSLNLNRRWTDADFEAFIRHRRSGLTMHQIAAEIGVRTHLLVNAVRRRKARDPEWAARVAEKPKRQGRPKYPWTDADRDKVRDLASQGHSMADIAHSFGYCRSWLVWKTDSDEPTRRAWEEGVKAAKRSSDQGGPISAELKALAAAALEAGMERRRMSVSCGAFLDACKAKADADGGVNLAEVADAMGWLPRDAHRMARQLNDRGMFPYIITASRAMRFGQPAISPEPAEDIESAVASVRTEKIRETLDDPSRGGPLPIDFRDRSCRDVLTPDYHGPQLTPEEQEERRLEGLRLNVKRYLREWKAAKRQPGFAVPRGPEHYREAQRIGMEELSERIRRNRRQAVA